MLYRASTLERAQYYALSSMMAIKYLIFSNYTKFKDSTQSQFLLSNLIMMYLKSDPGKTISSMRFFFTSEKVKEKMSVNQKF